MMLPLVAIDVPIGLPERGPRACDREARGLLGARRSSVFPAPVRAAIGATTHEEASARSEAASGRRVSAQTFHILRKIREVDGLLCRDAAARAAFVEVHPELSFRAWNRGRPMAQPKKDAAGRRARLRLAEAWLGRGVLADARGHVRKKDLADDDVLDAIAALWTAVRIARGDAVTVPEDPPRDARGLPMRIVC